MGLKFVSEQTTRLKGIISNYRAALKKNNWKIKRFLGPPLNVDAPFQRPEMLVFTKCADSDSVNSEGET